MPFKASRSSRRHGHSRFYLSLTEVLRPFNTEARRRVYSGRWTWEHCGLSLTASGVLGPSGWTLPLRLLLGLPVLSPALRPS